ISLLQQESGSRIGRAPFTRSRAALLAPSRPGDAFPSRKDPGNGNDERIRWETVRGRGIAERRQRLQSLDDVLGRRRSEDAGATGTLSGQGKAGRRRHGGRLPGGEYGVA